MATNTAPRVVAGDPGYVFLTRASELARLQQRIISTIQTEVIVESEGHTRSFDTAIAQPSPEGIASYVQGVLGNLEASNLRMRDIQVMFQLFFSRYVDDFQTFLEHALRDIAVFEPSVLADVPIKKSAQTLPPSDRLQRQLRRLSYLSIREITEALNMHFDLFPAPSVRTRIEQIYELRNLYVHNYGIVDDHFLARFKDPTFVEGQAVELDPNFVEAAVLTLLDASRDIRTRAALQFRISWRAPATAP